MWTEPEVDFDGRWYQIERGWCAPKPLQPRPRILVGALGERLGLKVVARVGDRCSFPGTPEHVAHLSSCLRGHCETEGRDFETIERSWFATGLVLRETEAQLAQAREDIERGRFAQHAELFCTPNMLRSLLEQYIALGITNFILKFADPPDYRSMELFAERILPALRA